MALSNEDKQNILEKVRFKRTVNKAMDIQDKANNTKYHLLAAGLTLIGLFIFVKVIDWIM